jgi:hypothetical protein
MKRTDTPRDGGRALPPGSGNYGENLFVSRVRQALDESANALPQATLARLALARKAALRAQTVPVMRLAPVSALAPAGMSFDGTSPQFGFGRTSLVFSAILLVGACLAGLYQFEQDRRIEELADVDTAVLNDDLPISAYADHGFNAFIKQNP